MRFLTVQLVRAHVQRQWTHPVCLHLRIMIVTMIITMIINRMMTMNVKVVINMMMRMIMVKVVQTWQHLG